MASPPRRCHILGLPIELRQMIYSCVFSFDHVINLDNYICSRKAKTSLGRLETTILSVCTTLRAEASPMLYENQVFSISERMINANTKPNMRDLRHFFLARIGEYNAKMIRHLMVDTSCVRILLRELRNHSRTYFSGLEILDLHFRRQPQGFLSEKNRQLYLGVEEIFATHPRLSHLILCPCPARYSLFSSIRCSRVRECSFFKKWAMEPEPSREIPHGGCMRFKLVAVNVPLKGGESVVDVGAAAKILTGEGQQLTVKNVLLS